MPLLRTWLTPRIAFWTLWTFWLWCLQFFHPDWRGFGMGSSMPVFIVGPPVLLTWAGSRLVRNAFDTPSTLFWKGAAVSSLLGALANIYLTTDLGGGPVFMVVAFLFCGYKSVHNADVKKHEIKSGDLFERVRALARRTGVSVNRVLVFTTPKDTPSAFAHRTGAILLSDRLLRLLSRNETDAVIAHEVAHLLPRQWIVVVIMPILAASAVLIAVFWPVARSAAPFFPVAALLLWRLLRRTQEYDADATAVRTTGDPEGLITALARISHVSGLPLHWGRITGMFMPHPPMTARFRAIGRKAGINALRVEELISAAGKVPALPGYDSPFAVAQPDDCPPLSRHYDRLEKRIGALNQVFPIAGGVTLSSVMAFWSPSFFESLVGIAIWLPCTMLVYWAAYEVIVGTERQRFCRQLSISRSPGDFFVGLSTAAEPRYFGNSYHYDVGLAAVCDGLLSYRGPRCSFSLQSSQVRRIWVGQGPRHWTPRKIICVDYQIDADKTGIVSFQSFERWFWPGTSRAANRLFVALEQWSQNAEVPSLPAAMPPQAIGALLPRLRIEQAWNRLGISCSISLGISWLMPAYSPADFGGLFAPFAAPFVTAALILFALAPHLDWSVSKTRHTSPRPSATAEPS